MASTQIASNRVYELSDSDSDEPVLAASYNILQPSRHNSNMEFLDTHHAPPKARKQVVDLTGDSPLRAASQFAQQPHPSAPGRAQPSESSKSSKGVSFAANASVRIFGPSEGGSFGSSIAKKSSSSSKAKPQTVSSSYGYGNYIKPSTPNAFKQYDSPGPSHISSPSNPFRPTQSSVARNEAWPSWLVERQPFPGVKPTQLLPPKATSQVPPPLKDDVDREVFDLNNVQLTAADYERHNGDADQHMRELLSGAIGDGEGEMGDDGVQDGEDVVEGFAKGVRLMPHQVRGVKWMKGRESGRKYGGILADDMGLGKTVQTLARIVQGMATTAERKAGWKAGTLIIAPLAVMEQWAMEAKTKTAPGKLRVTTHHGPSRKKFGKDLESYDVVITTFQTVASEYQAYLDSGEAEKATQKKIVSDSDSDSESFAKRTLRKSKKGKALTALFDVKWLRIVVDEAQNIKNRKAKASKAATALQAKYRWCLTGTPIQNNVEELFSLFQFLRARPLDNWDIFRDRIARPIKNNETKIAMKRLHVILKAIMLRRTKDAQMDGKPILNLPGRTVEIVSCEFDTEEREFYTALEKQTELKFNKFLRAGSVMSNYTSVLTMLLRLRQACDHPSLCASALSVDADALDNKPVDAKEDVDQADELADLLGGLGVGAVRTCEICATKLSGKDEKTCEKCSFIAKTALSKAGHDEDIPPTSAKIKMLMKLLQDIEVKSQSTQKTIVFSQFTSFLNLIEPFLRERGIRFVRYDGSMRNDKRQESLERIKSDPAVRVILISFKAGSTGLNLTCCNNVILMDLWWNPALEDQAFDRAHRLGQKLDVNIYKLTIGETVEDRILDLQQMKRELAKAALSGDAKNLTKLTLNDLMALFKPQHQRVPGRVGHDSDDGSRAEESD